MCHLIGVACVFAFATNRAYVQQDVLLDLCERENFCEDFGI